MNILNLWFVQVLLLPLFAYVFQLCSLKTLRFLRNKKLFSNFYPWQALLLALPSPLRILVWSLSSLLIASTIAGRFEWARLESFFIQMQSLSWLLFFFLSSSDLKKSLEKRWLTQARARKLALDPLFIEAIGKILSIALVILNILILLHIFGLPLRSLLIFGGVGSLSVGFAAKDMIANFFGGFMIYINRPFQVGDWISSPEKEIEGTVEEIGWYMTRICSFASRPIYVPNALFTQTIVVNPSRMRHRRIVADIGLRYEDAALMPDILQDIRQMLRSHEEIEQTKTLMVHFLRFTPSSLEINVYTFLKTSNWEKYRDVQEDIFLKITNIIEERGAQIAYPTQSLHLLKEQK